MAGPDILETFFHFLSCIKKQIGMTGAYLNKTCWNASVGT